MTACSSPFEDLLCLIEKTSKKEKKSLMQKGLKLQEEVGELSEAILSLQKASGMQDKKRDKQDIMSESADILLVALDIFFACGGTRDELCQIMLKKEKKWQSKQSK